MKPCLHINTSDMKPEAPPSYSTRNRVLTAWTFLYLYQLPFYFNAIEGETEERAGLYPAPVGWWLGS